MTKERYETLTHTALWICICSFLLGTIIYGDEIKRDEVFSVGEILIVVGLVAFLVWTLMFLLFPTIGDHLLPSPTKYRLRIESTNIKSKYILESKKSGHSSWSVEKVFEEMDSAIAEKQKLEDQEVHKIQIINL